MRATRSRRFVVGLALIVATAGGVVAGASGDAANDDWPQFRGPQRDGRSSETGLLDRWPADGPQKLWQVPLGDGYSGLSVYRGRIYTMFGRDGEEFATAINAETGETIWTFGLGKYRADRQGGGPRSTPTVDDGVVYALGARANLVALNAGDGQPVWSHDLVEEYGARVPRWGVATSPLVEGNRLIVDVGGKAEHSIVAFDKATGRELWSSFDDEAGYAAPIAFTVSGRRHVLVFTAHDVVAVDPDSGFVLWTLPWETSYDVNAATPIFIPPDRFFVSSGYDVGGAVYRIDVGKKKIKVEQVWKNREMKNQFSSSVLVDGFLYGFDDRTLKCIDAATGERRWRERGLGHGSLIYADGKLIVLGDDGTLVLVQATPDAYREQGRVQLVDAKTWTMPSLAGGRLYVRDQQQLVALDLTE